MGCFTIVLNTCVFVFLMVTLIRWFEQTIEAVDHRAWGQLTALIVFPFAVWFFPSRVAAGRPTPFPLHEPVRGFGSVPLAPPPAPAPTATDAPKPLPPVKRKSAIDPEQIAKLKEKMRQQGMLPPQE
jgi:hypothetical protein